MGVDRAVSRTVFLFALAWLGAVSREARADRMYTIRDLGTLPGTTQSIATGINSSGQVVGISYSSSDGTWQDVGVRSPLGLSYDTGARSFLYTNGQVTQINPTDGPANAINDAGQVVGGHYSSINSAGDYVGSNLAGLTYRNQDPLTSNQLVTGEGTTALNMAPVAINNSGEIAGWVLSNPTWHAAIMQNGKMVDLSSQFGLRGVADAAVAIANSGGAIVVESQQAGQPSHYWLYDPKGYHFNGETGPGMTDLTSLPGGSGKVALALNDLNQVVGNGFLYSNGNFTSLQSLLSGALGSQWSNLNATGINDAGQIVGQGLINGQEHAFLMTPTDSQVPEPSTWLIFGLATAGFIVKRGFAQVRHHPRRQSA